MSQVFCLVLASFSPSRKVKRKDKPIVSFGYLDLQPSIVAAYDVHLQLFALGKQIFQVYGSPKYGKLVSFS